MKPTIKPNYATTYHKDGTVSYWDVHRQQWQRKPAAEISDAVQSTLTEGERTAISRAAAALGKKGGKAKTAAKAEVAKENGKRGGRPRIHWHPAPARGCHNPAAEFYRYTVRRLSDGAERFTDSRPRVRSDKYLAWDNQENREV